MASFTKQAIWSLHYTYKLCITEAFIVLYTFTEFSNISWFAFNIIWQFFEENVQIKAFFLRIVNFKILCKLENMLYYINCNAIECNLLVPSRLIYPREQNIWHSLRSSLIRALPSGRAPTTNRAFIASGTFAPIAVLFCFQ